MKPIILKDANKDRINAAIAAAEGKCSARLIDYNSMVYAIERIENRLNIPKKDMRGITISVDVNARTFPGAYKGTPQSTVFAAVHTGRDWKIIEITRENTRSETKGYRVNLTEAAKNAIINRMELF